MCHRSNRVQLITPAVLSLPLLLAAAGCHSDGGHAHWGYSGEAGPDHWADLGYPLARDGREQSPIDITRVLNVHQPIVRVSYAFQEHGERLAAILRRRFSAPANSTTA